MPTPPVSAIKLSAVEQLANMLYLQNEINVKSLGPDWIQKASAVDRKVFYDLAYAEELFELANTVHYKWWKAPEQAVQYQKFNVQVELVDALHFLLSMFLVRYKFDYDGYYESETGLPYIRAAEVLYPLFPREPVPASEWKFQLRKCLSSTFERQLSLFEGHVNDHVVWSNQVYADFYGLCTCFDLDLEKLYTFYLTKNILNGFRQDNGYKEGTYRKIWGQGREDSFHAFQAVEQGLHPLELQKFLKEAYAEVIKDESATH